MKEKRISFGQGHGSLAHNNREFMASNVDPLRTPNNITFVCQPIAEAYDLLFKESTVRYNARQKRNDRKIGTQVLPDKRSRQYIQQLGIRPKVHQESCYPWYMLSVCQEVC